MKRWLFAIGAILAVMGASLLLLGVGPVQACSSNSLPPNVCPTTDKGPALALLIVGFILDTFSFLESPARAEVPTLESEEKQERVP